MNRVFKELSAQTVNSEDLLKFVYSPFNDEGLTFLGEPEWLWKRMPAANTHAHAVSAWSKQQEVLERELDALNAARPQHSVMYNISPIHISTGYIDEGISVEDKVLWSFRKKGRLKHIFRNHLSDYFETQQAGYLSRDVGIAVSDGDTLDRVSNAMTMRLSAPGINNYYHAVWECLPLLVPAHEAKFPGKISLRSASNALPSFFESFLDAVFPELKPQVELDAIRPKTDPPSAGHFEDFVSLLEWNFYSALWPGEKVDKGLPENIEATDVFDLRNPLAYFFETSNSYSALQKSFRDRAVLTAKQEDASHLPRRFWISRKNSVRRPEIKGETKLVEALRSLGFVEVLLEELSVMEQVNLFQNAEIAIGQHGAGMTNMMFASPETYVFEIGHGQTVQRWRTFHQMAAVSGCRYECFFADYDTEDPTKKPNMARDGFPVPQVTDVALKAIVDRVKSIG